MPHIVRGLLALETSASTGCAAPCKRSTASCAPGVPAQLARRAAHAGTAAGGGATEGVGEGLGLASALGLGKGLGVGELAVGVCLATGARGPLGVHAAPAARQRRRATPNLTEIATNKGIAGLRGSAASASRPEYRLVSRDWVKDRRR